MLTFKKITKYAGAVLLSATLVFLAGCGRKKPSDPPKSRSELVLEILELLKNKEHELAMKKVGRLREIDPTNVFLANLEIAERNNMIIVQAQEEVNKGDLVRALEKINEGIKKFGRHNDLLVAQQKLAVTARIDEILAVFKQPENSTQLKEAAIQLKEIGSKYQPVAPFVPIADAKIKQAEEMDKWETRRAIESLCSYIDMMIDANDPDTKLLFAVLEVADPYNTTLLNYLDYLKGNDNLSLKTYEDTGDLFSSDLNRNTGADIKATPEDKKENTPGTEIKTEDNKSEDKDNKKGWWNKFTF